MGGILLVCGFTVVRVAHILKISKLFSAEVNIKYIN